jgi:hypothetical protein
VLARTRAFRQVPDSRRRTSGARLLPTVLRAGPRPTPRRSAPRCSLSASSRSTSRRVDHRAR